MTIGRGPRLYVLLLHKIDLQIVFRDRRYKVKNMFWGLWITTGSQYNGHGPRLHLVREPLSSCNCVQNSIMATAVPWVLVAPTARLSTAGVLQVRRVAAVITN